MALQRAVQPGVWSERLRMLSVGVLTGMGVGLAAAICARLIMRIIAVSLGHATMFTAATFVLLRTGLYHGILMGVLFIAIRHFLPGVWLVKGVVFGILLFALTLLPFVLPFVGELQGAPVLGTVLFAALFLATGIAEMAAVAWLEQHLPAPRRCLSSLLAYGLLTVVALYIVLSFVMGSLILLVSRPFPQLGGH